MFHVELAPLGGILDPLKSDLGEFWAKYCHFLHILSNAQPKTNVFFLGHTQVIYLGSKALHIIGVWDSKIIGTMHCDQLVIWSSVHLLLHQVDFICLVRPRLAEGETWLDSSRWGIAVQL